MSPTDAMATLNTLAADPRCRTVGLLFTRMFVTERVQKLRELDDPNIPEYRLQRALVEGSFVELTVWAGEHEEVLKVWHWDLGIACAEMLERLDKEFPTP